MKERINHKESAPEFFKMSITLVAVVITLTTLMFLWLLGWDQWEPVLAVVGGAVLFSFVMEGLATLLVHVMCGAFRGIGRSLGYIVGSLRD